MVKSPYADSPDGELLKHCARMVEFEASWRRAFKADDKAMMPDEYAELAEIVRETTAHTLDGNRAKITVAVASFFPDGPSDGTVGICSGRR